MIIIAPMSSANAEEETTEKEQMGIRTKNNWVRVWRKTILAPDDEVTL